MNLKEFLSGLFDKVSQQHTGESQFYTCFKGDYTICFEHYEDEGEAGDTLFTIWKDLKILHSFHGSLEEARTELLKQINHLLTPA